jgi:flagellar biosynthesis protein FlhB
MSDEKTEKPSKKRLDDARKKGQVIRSKDLASAAAAVAATFAIVRFGGHLLHQLSEKLAADLSHFGDDPLGSVTTGEVTGMVLTGSYLLAILVGPIALITAAAGAGIHGLQGGWNFAPEALQPNFSRLSPINGLKRFSPMQSGPDTLKTLVGAAVVAYIGWGVTKEAIDESLGLAWLTPLGSASVAWSHLETLLWRIGWALLFLAIGDYALQHYRGMKNLKMSRKELRDEAKGQEGNAEVKNKVRRIQRDMARRRMISDVRKATVVITNPTHYAVALEYRKDMGAPRVLAKGRDHVAARIREEARKHEIPIVENKPLAQTLFKSVEVGDIIPAQLFAAVAEVLAYLVRIKQLML